MADDRVYFYLSLFRCQMWTLEPDWLNRLQMYQQHGTPSTRARPPATREDLRTIFVTASIYFPITLKTLEHVYTTKLAKERPEKVSTRTKRPALNTCDNTKNRAQHGG